MKYEGVCIAVKDVNISKKFYQELFGFEIEQDYGINVSFGGLSIQQDFDRIIGVSKQSIINKSHNMELYFEEDNFDEFIFKLKLHNIIYLTDGISETSWGQRAVRFYDPDAHIIEVGENLKMVIKRFLDSGMSIEDTSIRMDISVNDLNYLLNNN